MLLSGLVNWLLRQALTLALIVAVLLAAAWLRGELKRTETLRMDRDTVAASIRAGERQIADLKRNFDGQHARTIARGQELESTLAQKRTERQRLASNHPIVRRIPFTGVWQQISLLDKQISALQASLDATTKLKGAAQEQLRTQLAVLEREQSGRQQQHAALEDRLAQTPIGRTMTLVRGQLPLALGLLLGIILTPIAISVFLYFVIAPWVQARRALPILPEAAGSIGPLTDGDNPTASGIRASAVSQSILLAEDEEILLRPEFLQSSAQRALKRTRWLLNPHFPFASLFSGMFLLTRVGAAGQEPVIVSATQDALAEVGVLRLSTGSALICQPRALVGVIQQQGQPMRMTRHWRLGSLHAWLTLQLRFLAFHGPGQLVLKGCRGIRVESAGSGRLINQAATLGFSGQVEYASSRCETFMSYWTGKEALFNDRFSGETGIYVCEEMPDPNARPVIWKDPLRWLSDTLLKVLGI